MIVSEVPEAQARVSSCWFPLVGFLISSSMNESVVISKNLVSTPGPDETSSQHAFLKSLNIMASCYSKVFYINQSHLNGGSEGYLPIWS